MVQGFLLTCLGVLVFGFVAQWSNAVYGSDPDHSSWWSAGLLFSWTFPISLLCCACWIGSCKHQAVSTKPSLDWGRSFGFGWTFKLLLGALVVRYGEARHPGPDHDFSIGIFNPSGLTSKTAVAAALPGDVWFGSETHLTHDGFRRFKTGLRALDSDFTYVVQGCPCHTQKAKAFGERAGVIALSRYPARPLAHDFPAGVFESSRVQIVGVAVGPIWIQVGIIYGFPDSRQHLDRTFRTETLVDAVVDRIGLQADGPRIICGDLNHGPAQLVALDRLKCLGFRELQEFASFRWGHQCRATTPGPLPIDQMWLSPEMQALLCGLSIHEEHWADHFSLEAHFIADPTVLASARWNMPQQFPWPNAWDCPVVCDWSNPTLAYASLWHQLEAAGSVGCSVSAHSFGRGQTLQTVHHYRPTAPLRWGRRGSEQPKFFGESLLHVRWFRQLRRIQALCRMLQCSSPSLINQVKMCEVWKAIRNSPGFGPGFCLWWSQRHVDFPALTFALPSVAVATQLLDGFRKEVRTLERQLQAARFQKAKSDRSSQPNLIFRDCAKESPEVLDTLVHEVVGAIVEVDPYNASVTLAQPCALEPTLPVVVQGSPRHIFHVDGSEVTLSDVTGVQVGDQIRQQVVHISDRAIMDEFIRVWKPRWNKLSHVVEGQWSQITQFCARTFGPIPWHFQPLSAQRLAHAFRHKKRKSAVGPDGVSRQDLISLPQSGLIALTDMMHAVEQGGRWPEQLVQGFVSSLHKGRGVGVDAYRPIVVYPLVLRTWSTLRAKDALHSLSSWLPPSVRGGIPGGQAKEIWFQVSQLIEASFAQDQALVGVVVDIQRAFNALPRWPIWSLLAQMDFPIQVVRGWASFLGQQSRRFRVRKSISEGCQSVTGFPEGCALSVFAMALVDMMLDAWLMAQQQIVHSIHTYVDDWHILARSPANLEQIWVRLLEFSRILDLNVDHRKSFVWAVRSSDRAALQEGPLQVLLASKALGAHHNFCRRKGNKALIDRVMSLQSLWTKLRSSASPYAVKTRALVQVAWPRAFFGISVVFVGRAHFQKLRTGAVRGLKADRIGSNPMAHLATSTPWADPEAWSILQTFREVREVGCAEAMVAMLQFIASGSGIAPPNGPASVLVDRASRLGWQLCFDGSFRDQFGKFSPLHLHWDALVARIKWSWPQVMSCEFSHRWTFAGIQNASLDEVSRLLKSFSPQDQVFLRCALDGTLYHDVSKTSDNRGADSQCVFCHSPDSVWHRLWECPAFCSCRQDFKWFGILHELPKAQTCHGWPMLSSAWISLQNWFCALPEYCRSFSLPCGEGVLDLFTDGTCACPTEPVLRYSAWSLTCAVSDVSVLEHSVLACSHTRGMHQTAFRAELEAMVVALEAVSASSRRARIWCDCLAVVRGVRRLQQGGIVKPNRSHSDLWLRIQHALSQLDDSRVQVVKVVSHASADLAMSEVERWAFWHNQLADRAATDFNQRRCSGFWERWTQTERALKSGRIIHQDILKVILKVAYLGRTLQPPQHPPSAIPAVPETIETEVPAAWVKSRWSFSGQLAKKYRHANVVAIHGWWQQIGVPALKSRVTLRWVSGVQLYIDFWFTMQFGGVISPVHGKWYTDMQQLPGAEFGVGKRAAMFVRLWTAYLKDNRFPVAHRLAKPHSGSLQYWCMCWKLPWSQRRLDSIDAAILRAYGHQVARPGDLAMTALPLPVDDW